MNHLQIYFICSLARSLARHSYVARSLHALSFPLQWIRSILWAFHKGAYEIPFTVYTGARFISVLIVRNVYGRKYWIVSFRSHSNRCSHFVRLFHCRSLNVLNSLCQSIALFHSVKNMTLDCLHPPEREKLQRTERQMDTCEYRKLVRCSNHFPRHIGKPLPKQNNCPN